MALGASVTVAVTDIAAVVAILAVSAASSQLWQLLIFSIFISQ
jgi:hypothetical protein